MVFENYADFYDGLYQDKDYQAECSFIKRIFETFSKQEVKTVLDIGCGTGSHALIFAGMGYTVTGIDLSEKMLQIAQGKAAERDMQIQFQQGDIRYLDLPKKFDAALAMFNVLGYQTTNLDIESAVSSVRKHLKPGGLFVFDVWFGPAVLKERPSERVKTIEQDDGEIIRYANPVLDVQRQTIKVNYTVSKVKQGQSLNEVKESHLVRFFFYQELLYFLEKNGFVVLKICPFMDLNGQVDERCWNISVISKAV